MSKEIDITGNKYGRLTVIRKTDERTKWGKPLWLCQCDCGNTKLVESLHLRKGLVTSCGCYRVECGYNKKQHGMYKHKLYKIYYDIRSRCYNPKVPCYPRYGGKGITMCDEWLQNKELFFNWCLNNGYKEGLVIDRIDSTKEYSPNNCRFVTILDNNNNRSCNIKLTDGVRVYRSIAECARENGYRKSNLWYYVKHGTLEKHTNFKIVK